MALACQPTTTAKTGLLSLKFNQDQSCLTAATRKGFRVWNADPFALRYERDLGGGIGLATMLFRSNIVALVGGGASPCFREDRVMIWDDHRGQSIAELCFNSPVRGVEMVRDAIAVALDGRVFVYTLSDLEIAKRIPTVDNPRGLVDIRASQGGTGNVIAALSTKAGHVEIHHSDDRVRCLPIRPLSPTPPPKLFPPFFPHSLDLFFFCVGGHRSVPLCLARPLFSLFSSLSLSLSFGVLTAARAPCYRGRWLYARTRCPSRASPSTPTARSSPPSRKRCAVNVSFFCLTCATHALFSPPLCFFSLFLFGFSQRGHTNMTSAWYGGGWMARAGHCRPRVGHGTRGKARRTEARQGRSVDQQPRVFARLALAGRVVGPRHRPRV
ncbi:WD40 domain protein [Pandoravirus japonicus]|uniref:WD40 domain protein n=1 Tax=Pandoravirus japonicus TaxID=2823154 RepID=A0A811BNG8_9VIRU|nr:WD40 domain protein [Pandoravirus japonicus]